MIEAAFVGRVCSLTVQSGYDTSTHELDKIEAETNDRTYITATHGIQK
jgi:hypothetical protein